MACNGIGLTERFFDFALEGKRMKKLLWRLGQEEEGQDLVEHALVLALLAFAAIAAMKNLSSGINQTYSNAASAVPT